ncbi:MAG: 2-dehydropantoate 2-reductase [Lachnospiraceae bacterium]|nr:2-dehydropantoate 2-reductase [Lachnospiraceae bacterium]
MKIAIIGSGALGCFFGAYLSTANEVCMIARREKVVDSINKDGITVYEKDGSVGHYKKNVSAALSGKCPETVDLVLMTVKGYDTESAMEINKNLIGDDTILMTVQNGGGNDLKLSKFVPRNHVIIAVTTDNAVNLDNGNISHSGKGVTTLGGDKDTARFDEVVAAFNASKIEYAVSDNIQRIIWNKLFVNLSINSFTAITKSPIGMLIDNEYAWNFAEKLVCEAIDVAEAEGQHFSYLDVLSFIRSTCTEVAGGFSSMSQDVMNCRRTEIDTINGYVVDRAAVHNVPAPYNTFVRNLVHAIENTYKEQIKQKDKYNAGDIIVREGEDDPTLYKVMHGSVGLYLNHGKENEYLLGINAKGSSFGEYSCFSGKASPYTAIAEEETIVMAIPKKDVHNYICLNPRNAEELFTTMSNKVAMLSKHIGLLNP